MHRFLSRFALPALLAAALWTGAPEARASLLPLSVEQLTDASDYIVRGTVSATWVEQNERGDYWTKVQIEVDEVYKGPAQLDGLELDVVGGLIGARGMLVRDVPRFDEQEEVLVFAERLDSGYVVPTGMRQGKQTVRIDPDNAAPMLVNYHPPLERPYDHRFIPHPPPADRIYLDDYVSRIKTRIKAGWDGAPIPGKPIERLRQMHWEVTR